MRHERPDRGCRPGRGAPSHEDVEQAPLHEDDALRRAGHELRDRRVGQRGGQHRVLRRPRRPRARDRASCRSPAPPSRSSSPRRAPRSHAGQPPSNTLRRAPELLPALLGQVRCERRPPAARAASPRPRAPRVRRGAARSCTPSSRRSPCCSASTGRSSPTLRITWCSLRSTSASGSPSRRASRTELHSRSRKRRTPLMPCDAEVAAFLVRAQEHEVHAERIGAPLAHVLVGIDDVALASSTSSRRRG